MSDGQRLHRPADRAAGRSPLAARARANMSTISARPRHAARSDSAQRRSAMVECAAIDASRRARDARACMVCSPRPISAIRCRACAMRLQPLPEFEAFAPAGHGAREGALCRRGRGDGARRQRRLLPRTRSATSRSISSRCRRSCNREVAATTRRCCSKTRQQRRDEISAPCGATPLRCSTTRHIRGARRSARSGHTAHDHGAARIGRRSGTPKAASSRSAARRSCCFSIAALVAKQLGLPRTPGRSDRSTTWAAALARAANSTRRTF